MLATLFTPIPERQRLRSRQIDAAGIAIRKRVEEIFGWIKTVGGFRRTRYLGIERTQAAAYFIAGTYNLLRMVRLEAASVG